LLQSAFQLGDLRGGRLVELRTSIVEAAISEDRCRLASCFAEVEDAFRTL